MKQNMNMKPVKIKPRFKIDLKNIAIENYAQLFLKFLTYCTVWNDHLYVKKLEISGEKSHQFDIHREISLGEKEHQIH